MPVPLPWRSKSFEIVGQDAIKFDYKGTQASGKEGKIKVQNVTNSVYTARKWLRKANGIVGADVTHWPQHVKDAYLLYFKSMPAAGVELEAVRTVLSATRVGVGNPMVIAAICRWRGESGSSTQGYVRGGVGRIHVSLKYFKTGSDQVEQVCIVVHEATHKFANTEDHAYFGEPDWLSLTHVEAVDNADSFCYFVRDINNGELSTAVEDDDDFGIGSLFD